MHSSEKNDMHKIITNRWRRVNHKKWDQMQSSLL